MQRMISFMGVSLPVSNSPEPVYEEEIHKEVIGTTAYIYDTRGNLREVREADGSARFFTYNSEDALVQQITAEGQEITYQYDPLFRLSRITYSNGKAAEFDYAKDSNTFRNEHSHSQFELDVHRRVTSIRQVIGDVSLRSCFQYDQDGCLTGVRPAGSDQWLLFDYSDGLTLRAENSPVYLRRVGNGWHFSNGMTSEVNHNEGLDISKTVRTDRSDEPVLTWTTRFNEQLQVGHLNDSELFYDREGRLIGYEMGDAQEVSFTYDERGNRTTRTDANGTTYYHNNELNRLTCIVPSSGAPIYYTYDRDGNRASRECGAHRTRYVYDPEGQLIEIWENGACLARYHYNAAGQRVSSEVCGETTLHHYDPHGKLLSETDECGSPVATYLWVQDRCVGCIHGGIGSEDVVYYHHDHLGSILATSDSQGQLTRCEPVDPFGASHKEMFTGKKRDQESGFYYFGARYYDPESARFLTPDTYTFAPDDQRVLFDSARDLWGKRPLHREKMRQWKQHPMLQNRYAFCLNDPVNNVDKDGHSAWWFFLTIPSSLTWAMPNTVIALILMVLNFLMEIIGWILWFFISLKHGFKLTSYPYGRAKQNSSNPLNPYDLNDRSHIWWGLEASSRLGVPWTIFNGSFFVWRPYTLGNAVFIDELDNNAYKGEVNGRFVVPTEPNVQLTRKEALYHHEMQHVFQYALFGPLFHCLPIPLLVRLIDSQQLEPEDVWWEKLDLGGLTWLAGTLVYVLTGGKVDPSDVQKWVNPATWWSQIPAKWVQLISNAWNMENWMPFVGVYEFSTLWFFRQEKSWFERNAGERSGDVYETIVKAEKRSIYVGEFTRVIGVDVAYSINPTALPPSANHVAFSFASGTPNVGPAAGSLVPSVSSPTTSPHVIDLDAFNSGNVRVINGNGFYFHSLDPGTYTIEGTGNVTNFTDDVEITVKDLRVKFDDTVFVCNNQVIRIKGDKHATYTLQFKSGGNNSGGSLSGMTYTAGNTGSSGGTTVTDTLVIFAKYAVNHDVFHYGDNGLSAHQYPVKEIQIEVKEPTISPAAPIETFVGDSVEFTFDERPQSGSSSSNVSGSHFLLASRAFKAGRGPIVSRYDRDNYFRLWLSNIPG